MGTYVLQHWRNASGYCTCGTARTADTAVTAPQVLGQGTFGLVLKGTFRSTCVAVKRMVPQEAKPARKAHVVLPRAASAAAEQKRSGAETRSPRSHAGDSLRGVRREASRRSAIMRTGSLQSGAVVVPPEGTERSLHAGGGSSFTASSSSETGDTEKILHVCTTYAFHARGPNASETAGVKRVAFPAAGADEVAAAPPPPSPSAPNGHFFGRPPAAPASFRSPSGGPRLGFWSSFSSNLSGSSGRTHRHSANSLKREFIQEIRLLVHLRHPNIVCVLGAAVDETSEPMMVRQGFSWVFARFPWVFSGFSFPSPCS